MIVIALVAILMMAALVLDGGHMLLNKTRLQNAVDAAALSGAKTLSQVMGSGNSASTARAAALFTLNENAKAAGNNELLTAIGGNPEHSPWWSWQTMSMGLSPSRGRSMPLMCGSRYRITHWRVFLELRPVNRYGNRGGQERDGDCHRRAEPDQPMRSCAAAGVWQPGSIQPGCGHVLGLSFR